MSLIILTIENYQVVLLQILRVSKLNRIFNRLGKANTQISELKYFLSELNLISSLF